VRDRAKQARAVASRPNAGTSPRRPPPFPEEAPGHDARGLPHRPRTGRGPPESVRTGRFLLDPRLDVANDPILLGNSDGSTTKTPCTTTREVIASTKYLRSVLAEALVTRRTTDSPPQGEVALQPAAAARLSSRPSHAIGGSLGKLAIGAAGVVFGDIGTSPLYALKECVDPDHGVAATQANLFGLVSLVFWSLTMVVTVKYLTFIMKADNRGEGGILALLALIPQNGKKDPTRLGWVAAIVLFGAALLYGDGVITPAISVLSAVEGLGVATTRLTPAVVPLTVIILAGLFWVQKRGTESIGGMFGPMMVVWFLVIAALGVVHIAHYPVILSAVHPLYAVEFFAVHRGGAFLVLGSVVLVITGGEALYADMGHFGRAPIRFAWFGLVMPALLLNYFGQAACIIQNPTAAANPFFAMAPPSLLYFMVALSTVATIIASQALISGAYSLTRQAVQLGFCPRVTIVHTSGEAEGQIFIPEVNVALAIACIWLVLTFKESSALAAAYGIAVTGTMAITSVVYFMVLTRAWHWPMWKAGPLVVLFLSFDIPFFGANALKFFHGGWFPIAVALCVFLVMTTWKKGRTLLGQSLASRMLPTEMFLEDIDRHRPHRVAGTAVFMSSNPTGIPIVLLHHWKHNQVLHETVVLLSILSEPIPEVSSSSRVTFTDLGRGFFQVTAHYGFMETPNVPQVMRRAAELGVPCVPARTSYFLGRETLLATGQTRMLPWRKTLFSFISRNSRSATHYFGIPPDRVVELGMQISF
jgi:KUP system potassium uptake protein